MVIDLEGHLVLTRHYAEYLLNSGEFENREKRNGKDLCNIDSNISE